MADPDGSVRSLSRSDAVVDENRAAAKSAGLKYVSDETPGITRKKSGTGWRFIGPDGKTIKDYWEKKRIEKIGIPPAYTDVWICPREDGHIQATGRDAKGRKQYRYHPKWSETRDSAKYERMMEFGKLLPGLRARVASDMRKTGFPREKVLATIVNLLEMTLIRVGNEDYVKENKSFGLTTLRNRHVAVDGATLRFDFKGKSGKTWNLNVKDRRVAKVVKAIHELPGQHLFQYLDEDGKRQPVDSADVNDYLREITGEDVTAKDFRTWAGTVLASMALSEFEQVDSQAAMKKNVKAAIEKVASRLGNTPTICRKCYVHPKVLTSYLDGHLLADIKQEVEAELCDDADKLKPEEAALLGLLSRRISKDLKSEKVA
ncbi:DNA topoisomerase IB [Beijerinckia sp. L45]|uniref:DNA topoisomerase IB n=1 Tax=Beijerinckia sp. L45 TaxID=1641855 RepID=UPI00131C5EF7|nr:DNA topoisomerase IB [Beijerinckia sp. L45]